MTRAEEITEIIADLEHDQWAHWMKYLMSKFYVKSPEGVETYTVHIPIEDIERWRLQIATPYKHLTEKEKESDRVWARKVIKAVKDFVKAWKDEPLDHIINPKTYQTKLNITTIEKGKPSSD